MTTPALRLSGLVLLLAVGLTAFLSPAAQSQMHAMPSYIPIGVSASGNTSTVWFHDPSSRQALACTTMTSNGAPGIQCVSAKLP